MFFFKSIGSSGEASSRLLLIARGVELTILLIIHVNLIYSMLRFVFYGFTALRVALNFSCEEYFKNI